MISVSNDFLNKQSASVRKFCCYVDVSNNSDTVQTFTDNDIVELEIQRVANNTSFFGSVISQRFNVKVFDSDSEITTSHTLKPYFHFINSEEAVSYPLFHVTEVNRNANTNQLSITGYDFISKTDKNTIEQISLPASYTIKNVADAIAAYYGTTVRLENINDSIFDTQYLDGANIEGTETIRAILEDIAEATQTICFVDYQNRLVFKRLTSNEPTIAGITDNDYISLDCKTNRKLTAICSVTELGDNVSASTGSIGTTQYLRDNCFLDLRDDVGTILENALTYVGDLTINQFSCNWFGNVALELGDKIAIYSSDNDIKYSYILDDTIKYDGSLREDTKWEYEDSDETESNPASLGDKLNKTFAKVDKVNKSIDLLVSSDVEQNAEISTLRLEQNSISATVTSTTNSLTESVNSLQNELSAVQQQSSLAMTPEQVNIAISQAINSGVSEVTTETGYCFNQDGLTISKTGSEMETLIDDDGMTVRRSGTDVLIADNNGVDAINLTAHQYLIIGLNSRFEDYDNNRTGCFYIGG